MKKKFRKPGSRGTSQVKFQQVDFSNILKDFDVDSVPDGYIAGWASTKDIDHVGDVILPGAFSESIEEKGLEGPKGIKLLVQHEADKPAGVIKSLKSMDNGLWIEAQLNLDISYVKDVYEAAKMNGGLSFSVGYRLVEGGFKFVDNETNPELSYWELSKVDLHEVSVVTFPCNEEAVMTFIKGEPHEAPFESVAEAEKALVRSGFAKSRREAHRFVRWLKGESLETPKEEPPVLASTKAVDPALAALKKLKEALS